MKISLEQASKLVTNDLKLADALMSQQRMGEAETVLRRVITFIPKLGEVWHNLGFALHHQHKFDEAIAAYQRAMALNFIDARLSLGGLLLALGRLEEGWPLFETRYNQHVRHPSCAFLPKHSFPQWRGESLSGKSIMIWPEQGIGDQIQFCRYASLLKQMGASRVDLFCPNALAPLFSTLNGADAIHGADKITHVPAYDFWTFPMSLPYLAETRLNNIPASPFYLCAPQCNIKLNASGFRVGLAWKGNVGFLADHLRSLPTLRLLAPLWDISGITFVNLQKGIGEDEPLRLNSAQPMVMLNSVIRDFADTAAIISQLDLVISTDKVIAHLAGALGKQVWTLLSFTPDWRWMLNREDSPWYPTMRLFRQPALGDWESVIRRVSEELKALVRDKYKTA